MLGTQVYYKQKFRNIKNIKKKNQINSYIQIIIALGKIKM